MTPPSLARLYSIVFWLISGLDSSSPIKDHVPQLIYANFLPSSAGTAAIALSVSWEATVEMEIFPTDSSSESSGRRVPIIVPGFTTGWNRFDGIPHFSINSKAHCFLVGLYNWVVDAMVYSLYFSPLRK